MSDSLRLHGLQHTRVPCPSLSPRVCSNSCPLSRWLTLSNHLILCHPFSSCPQSFPASRSLQMSRLFVSGGQRIGASASAPVPTTNIQGWFLLWLVGSPCCPRNSQVFSKTTVQKYQFFGIQLYGLTLTSGHDYWKNYTFDLYGPLSAKWCLCFLSCCLGLS